MIYTLTTNPAIDMNFSTPTMSADAVNRTSTPLYTPNGKGINVSRVLRHFGLASQILGFFGGFTGDYIVAELSQGGYAIHPVVIAGITRINIFINGGQREYKFVNSGAHISDEKQREMLRLIGQLPNMTHLIISGSLPAGITESYYDELLSICKHKDVAVILDISAAKLRELLSYKPLLIKPNDQELHDIFGLTISSDGDALAACRMLAEKGAQNILLTLGEKGLYYYAADTGRFYFADAPNIELVSSACAGDSCLAAFLSEFLVGGETETALKKASATGADVAGSEGLGELMRVNEYMQQITVREVFCT